MNTAQKSTSPARNLAITYRPVSWFVPYEKNPRKNDSEIDRMVGLIAEFGFAIPILARSDGTVIDGHLRLKAAKKLGLAELPAILCDQWTPAQVKAFRIAANKSVAWAEWDNELLAAEITDILELGYDPRFTGFDAAEIDSLLSTIRSVSGLTDDDAAPKLADNVITNSGDLWLLGNHRLLCGNSTSITDLQRLMNDEKADAVFTDPPYNQGYSGRGEVNQLGPIENDELPDESFDEFISGVFACCSAAMKESACIYVCHPDSRSAPKIAFETHFARHFHKAATIIWVKQSAGMGWQDYRAQHEAILYGWKDGKGSHYFTKDRSKTTIWEIGRDAQVNYVHPTQKPVALAEEAIMNSSKRGAVVLDLFGGSGSTLIACEKTKRLNRIMEVDPKYCDVIIRRWEAFSGKQAVLVSEGRSFAEVAANRKGAL